MALRGTNRVPQKSLPAFDPCLDLLKKATLKARAHLFVDGSVRYAIWFVCEVEERGIHGPPQRGLSQIAPQPPQDICRHVCCRRRRFVLIGNVD